MTDELSEAVSALLMLEATFTEPEFLIEIEDFVQEHVTQFSRGEQSLQDFEVFQKFSQKIDHKLDEFAAEATLSQTELLRHCEVIFSQDPLALTCFEYIAAALSYEDFLALMLSRKALAEWESH